MFFLKKPNKNSQSGDKISFDERTSLKTAGKPTQSTG
jgi:hypothetical protein